MQLTSQITTAERERSAIDITIKEIDAMADNTRTYMAIGKMFALRPKDELRTELAEAKDESLKKDGGHKDLREQFVNKLRESESRIDELAAQIEATRAKVSQTEKP